MARERKKAKKAAARRSLSSLMRQAKRGIVVVGGQRAASLALGQSLFAIMIDDANFLRNPFRDTESMPEYPVEKHTNEMLAIAEAMATPEEVMARLERVADSAFRDVRRWHKPIREAREHIRRCLDDYIDEHYFAGFHRNVTVGAILKRKLVGYQKRWNVKELLVKKIMKRVGMSQHRALEEADDQLRLQGRA